MERLEFERMVGERVTLKFYEVCEKVYMANEYFLCGHDFVNQVFSDNAKTFEDESLAGKSLDIKLAEYLRTLWIEDRVKRNVDYEDNYEDIYRERIRKEFRAYTKAMMLCSSSVEDEVARLIA